MEPMIKIKDRGLSSAVFAYQNQDGSVNLSVSIQRSYKKKDAQEWTQEHISCYEDDLLKIANLCTRTYNAIVNYRDKKSQQKAQQPAQQQPAQQQAPAAAPIDDEIPF